jgi:hypothetical protein
VVATPGALALLHGCGKVPSSYLYRHLAGDWGDLDAHDRRENERALKTGVRLFSSYDTPAGKIWIITEADRSSTCILLPSEY